MIFTKKDLEYFVKKDLRYYYAMKDSRTKKIYSWFIRDNVQMVKKFIIQLRKTEYYYNNTYLTTGKKNNLLFDFKYLIAKRKLNYLQTLLGLEIYENSFGPGLTIYHTGGTVIHPNAKIGKDCKLHGNNCIGNDGKQGDGCPNIGNGVQIGVGSKIIGDVVIADDIIIAAGAIVVDSFLEPGIVLAGVPAKKVR